MTIYGYHIAAAFFLMYFITFVVEEGVLDLRVTRTMGNENEKE